jgi:hypothetical protein
LSGCARAAAAQFMPVGVPLAIIEAIAHVRLASPRYSIDSAHFQRFFGGTPALLEREIRARTDQPAGP